MNRKILLRFNKGFQIDGEIHFHGQRGVRVVGKPTQSKIKIGEVIHTFTPKLKIKGLLITTVLDKGHKKPVKKKKHVPEK